jgi:hypothetical protein
MLIEVVAQANDDRRHNVLAMLLDAVLSTNAPMGDGRSVVFHQFLTADAARLLLARGVDRQVHDARGGAADWSPVTYQADLRNWVTALVRFDGGERELAVGEDPYVVRR